MDAETVEVRGDLTAAGAIMGTPDFISPEQAEDAHSADIRSDIYSLGSTLYFLLSGQAPFHDGSVMHKLKSHAQAEPQPLHSLREDVPPELVAVVEKMTAKNPEERYLTPSEVSDALESFLRDWQSDSAKSPVHEGSGDGNMSNSGGQQSGAGDMNPDWLSSLATWLYYISLIPIALLVIDVFSADETDVSSPDRVWYYMLASICLSSIAAVATGIQKSRSDTIDSRDHRISRMSASDLGLITAVLLVAGVCYFSDSWTDGPEHFISGGAGVGGDDWYVTSGGTYVMEDEPGVLFGMVEAPNGDRSLSYVVLFLHDRSELTQASSAQNASLQFDGRSATIRDGISIDGKTFAINLEMEMEAQDIKSTRININGESIDPSMGRLFLVDLTSDDVSWHQLDRAFPKHLPAPSNVVSDTELVSSVAKQVTDHLATDDDGVHSFLTSKTAPPSKASINEVTRAQPELKITRKTVNRGTGGLPSMHDWDLSGREVQDLRVQLLLAQDGKANLVQDFDFEELPAEFTSKVRLQFSDAATGADRKRRVNALLYVESPANSRSQTTNQDKALSFAVEAPFSNSLDLSDVKTISHGDTELLFARSYWKGDMTHGTSVESMIEATKDGNVTFLFVTLAWKPAVEPKVSVQGGARQSEAEFETRLHTAISRAAGIPKAELEKLATSQMSASPAEFIKGAPLSSVLLLHAPGGETQEERDEFEAFRLLTDRMPKPRELHQAMSLSQEQGYVSVIQPEYIQSATLEVDPESKLLQGTVEFEAPKLYAGKVSFVARQHAGRMQVVEFTLRNRGLTIARDEDGVWRRKASE